MEGRGGGTSPKDLSADLRVWFLPPSLASPHSKPHDEIVDSAQTARTALADVIGAAELAISIVKSRLKQYAVEHVSSAGTR